MYILQSLTSFPSHKYRSYSRYRGPRLGKIGASVRFGNWGSAINHSANDHLMAIWRLSVMNIHNYRWLWGLHKYVSLTRWEDEQVFVEFLCHSAQAHTTGESAAEGSQQWKSARHVKYRPFHSFLFLFFVSLDFILWNIWIFQDSTFNRLWAQRSLFDCKSNPPRTLSIVIKLSRHSYSSW